MGSVYNQNIYLCIILCLVSLQNLTRKSLGMLLCPDTGSMWYILGIGIHCSIRRLCGRSIDSDVLAIVSEILFC